MPFTRQRHNGTNETHLHPTQESPSNRITRNRYIQIPPQIIGLLALATPATLLNTHSATARPRAKSTQTRRLPGAWGWTTGSRTYLRVRPSAETPAVAKVPRRTKMFVWGKYNGWYRVETPDHIFGWVYHSYINCPKKEKIAELSGRKAKIASNRGARQTMYGSPQMLRSYYAQYKAPGAAEGLQQMGVRVASAPKPRSSKSRYAARQRFYTRSIVIRSKPKYATRKPVKSSPRLAARPMPRTVTRTKRPSPARTLQVKVASTTTLTRVTAHSATAATRARARNAMIARPPVMRIPATGTNDSVSTPLAPSQPDEMAAAQRASREAEAQQAAAREARARRIAAQRAAEQRAAAQRIAALKAEEERVAARRAAMQRAAARRAAVRRAAAQRAAARRRAAQMAAAQRRNRLAAQRARLRRNMGSAVTMTPPMAIPGLRPISPDELIRARDEFLSSGRKSAPAPSSERRDNLQGRLPAGSPDSDPRMSAITPSAFDTSVSDSIDFDDTGLNDISLDMSFQTVGANDLAYGTFYDIVDIVTVEAADLPQLSQLSQVFVMSHAKIIAKTPGNIGYDTREPVNSLPGSKGTLFGTPGGVVNSENLVLPATPGMQPSPVQPSVAPSFVAPPTTPPVTMERAALPPVAMTLRPTFTIPLRIAKTVPKGTPRTKSKRTRRTQPGKVASRVQGKLPSRGGSPRDYLAHMPQNSFGQGIASQALSYRGMPYIYGAQSPRRGFDCSGLIYFLLRQRGYNPPRTAAGLASYGLRVSYSNLQPGDILLFSNTYRRGVSHAGVYLGDGRFVHAASTGKGVRVDALSGRYWGRKFHSARRVK